MLQWILIFIAAFIAYVKYRQSKEFRGKVDKMFKGPPTLPLIGNSALLWKERKDSMLFAKKLHEEYNGTYRIWNFNQLNIMLGSAEEVEKVFGNNIHTTKADHYKRANTWLGEGVLTARGNKWKKSRKLAKQGFSYTLFENFQEIFNKNEEILCEALESRVGGPHFDVYPVITMFILDNLCETLFGTTINAQKNPEQEFVRATHLVCEIGTKRVASPWLWPDFIFDNCPIGREFNAAVQSLSDFSAKITEKRKKLKQFPDIKETNMLPHTILESYEEENISFQEVTENVNTLIFGGHDTTSLTLSFALYELAENPECQEKAYEEQFEIFGNDTRSSTVKELNLMKYLEKVIKETLRHYSPIPFFGRLIEEDIVLDEDRTIPKGAQVMLFPNHFHSDKSFWERPNEFYPEHFDLEATVKRSPYQFIAFSVGARNCIGMRYAYLELKSVLSTILRRFRIIKADPAIPLQIKGMLTIKSTTGINIRLEKR